MSFQRSNFPFFVARAALVLCSCGARAALARQPARYFHENAQQTDILYCEEHAALTLCMTCIFFMNTARVYSRNTVQSIAIGITINRPQQYPKYLTDSEVVASLAPAHGAVHSQ